MTIQSYVMGPGTFTVGTSPVTAGAQVAAMTVTCSEKVKTTEPEPMLSGEDLTTPDVVSLEWKLTAKFVQDLAAAGLVAFTWDEAMEEHPFTFVPNTAGDRGVTGTVRIVPIAVGGDPKTRPKSDVTWVIVGTPALGDATP